MTEQDLSTLLRHHLEGEPPLGVTSAEAIRAGRGPSRARLAVAGATTLAATALAVTVVGPGLGGDEPGRARDLPAAGDAPVALTDTVDALARDRLGPLVGELGDPVWDVTDVAGDPVDAEAATPQYVQVTYPLTDAAELHLRVGGFAEADGAFFLSPACPAYEAEGVTASCTDETLPDGTVVTTSVNPHTRATNTGSRLPSVPWALAHPDRVLWSRSVAVATPDGVTTSVAEYAAASSPDAAVWRIPVETLRAAATDPDLLDPASVAHAPLG